MFDPELFRANEIFAPCTPAAGLGTPVLAAGKVPEPATGLDKANLAPPAKAAKTDVGGLSTHTVGDYS
jgi:hypothetical protein